MNKENNPGKLKPGVRALLVVAGSMFLVLGVLGIFLPLLPTTPFMLLAAACYARSSRRLHAWLLNNRWFGKYLTNYLQGKGIPLRVKITATVTLWVTIGVSVVFFTNMLLVRILLPLIAGVVTWHLWIVPTIRR